MPLLQTKKKLKKQIYLAPGVEVEERSLRLRSIPPVATSDTAMIGAAISGPLYKAVKVQSFLEFQKKFGQLKTELELGYAVQQFYLNGGQTLWIVRAAKALDEQRLKRALSALDGVKDFSLLTVPGFTDPRLLENVVAYGRQRGALTLMDFPKEVRTAQAAALVVQKKQIPETADAALYYPWLQVIDSAAKGQLRRCAPSGSVAGLISRIDQARGVWKSPAGLEASLKGVKGLDEVIAPADQTLLSSQSINFIKAADGKHFMVWGARTLEGIRGKSGSYRYVAVRRLSLFIEKSISRGMNWVVFEPNDEPLWASVRASLENFMQTLFQAGAFQGSSSREAYFVRCDKSTITAKDIARQQVHALVGFAPLKPAEFVTLAFTFKSA